MCRVLESFDSTHCGGVIQCGTGRADRVEAPATMNGISQNWRAQSASQQELDVANSVSSHHQLKLALDQLKSAISTAGEPALDALSRIEQASSSLGDTLHSFAETKYFNYQHGPTGPGAAAEEFFDIAEISERIMINMDIEGVLAMQRVNKRLYAIVEGSNKLQRLLHLLSNSDTELHLLQSNTALSSFNSYHEDDEGRRAPFRAVRRGLHMHSTSRPVRPFLPYKSVVHPDSVDIVRIQLNMRRKDYLAAPQGSRLRRMLLTQPPVTKLDVALTCCYADSRDSTEHFPTIFSFLTGFPDMKSAEGRIKHPKKIENENGVTVGEVYDACLELADAHKLCPFASEHDHDQDGWVRPSITFSGKVSLTPKPTPEQPLNPTSAPFEPMIGHPHGVLGSLNEKMDHQGLLRDYVFEKQRVAQTASPVPTFAEFKAGLKSQQNSKIQKASTIAQPSQLHLRNPGPTHLHHHDAVPSSSDSNFFLGGMHPGHDCSTSSEQDDPHKDDSSDDDSEYEDFLNSVYDMDQ